MRFLEIAAGYKRGLNWDAIRDVADPAKGVEKYDLRKLPIENVSENTYNGVYSEHFIEHLTKEEGIAFFEEMLRILKPGGVIRTIWPPLEFVEWLRQKNDLSDHPWVKKYYNFYVVKHKFAPSDTDHLRVQDQCAEGIMYQNGEHKHIWSKFEMIDTLKMIGYIDVKEKEYQKSSMPDFQNIDTAGEVRSFHSAVIEARKPW